MVDDKAKGFSHIQAVHRTRLEQVRNEATSLAGNAARIAQAINQVLEKGGQVNIQPQMNFITGAYARMLKDLGVIEQLQSQGVRQRPPPQTH